MLIRKLERDDLEQLIELMNICFGKSVDPRDAGVHFQSDDYWREVWGVVLDNRLVAAIVSHFCSTNVRCRAVRSLFILQLATIPSFRKRGLASELLTYSMRRCRDKGVPLILLEPFDASFFRQFGFEHVFNSLELEIPVKVLREASSGSIKITEGSILHNAQLKALTFEYFDRKMKHSRFNESRVPEVFSNRRHASSNKQVAIARNSEGEPIGIIIFRQEGRTIIVELIMFDSLEALEALSNCLQRFSTQVDTVRIPGAEEDFPFEHIMKRSTVPEEAITVRQSKPIMGRIIDTDRLLNTIKPVAVDEGLCVAVADSMIKENSGTYLLSSDGTARTRLRPDISMKQSDLCLLATGSMSAIELFREKRLRVHSDRSTSWIQTAIPSAVKKLDTFFPRIPTGWHYL